MIFIILYLTGHMSRICYFKRRLLGLDSEEKGGKSYDGGIVDDKGRGHFRGPFLYSASHTNVNSSLAASSLSRSKFLSDFTYCSGT